MRFISDTMNLFTFLFLCYLTVLCTDYMIEPVWIVVTMTMKDRLINLIVEAFLHGGLFVLWLFNVPVANHFIGAW